MSADILRVLNALRHRKEGESMKQQHANYQVVPYAKMRRLEAIAYRSMQYKSMMHGLIEVDVTRARTFLRDY